MHDMMAAFFTACIAILSFFSGTALHFIAEPFAPHQASVLFGGDMMFDRSIRTTINEKGGDFIFSCLGDTLEQADLVVANLEGPITDNPSKSVGSAVGGEGNFTFTFPLSTATLLKKHNIGIVNLGNNHISNFMSDGVRETLRTLDDAGVQHFGDPLTQSVASTTIRGIRLAFINYNQFENTSTKTLTVEQIRAARAAGQLPVVYAHWGEEYLPATEYEKDLAHAFVDAGAEIVIGSHPHVVQESEVYAGKHVYYSLGNMIFDQYWNDAVRNGLMLDVAFSSSGVTRVVEVPVRLDRDRRTCLR